MTYEGQPEYVRAGFLVDVMKPWVDVARMEGSEWGDLLEALHEAASACVRVSNTDRALTIIKWFMDEMSAAEADAWWGLEDEAKSEFKRARLAYVRVVDYWLKRAPTFKGSAVLLHEIDALPSWVFPTDGDVLTHEDDPQYNEYLRLKKKFEPEEGP